jgi:hypothetical protein
MYVVRLVGRIYRTFNLILLHESKIFLRIKSQYVCCIKTMS